MVRSEPLRKQLLKFNLEAIAYTRVQEQSENLGRITKMGSCLGSGVCITRDGRWQERCLRKKLLSLNKDNTNAFKISCITAKRQSEHCLQQIFVYPCIKMLSQSA